MFMCIKARIADQLQCVMVDEHLNSSCVVNRFEIHISKGFAMYIQGVNTDYIRDVSCCTLETTRAVSSIDRQRISTAPGTPASNTIQLNNQYNRKLRYKGVLLLLLGW